MPGLRLPRRVRVVATLGVVIAALTACNPLTVWLYGETGAPGCVNGSTIGPVRYVGPSGAHLSISISAGDPAVADKSLQIEFPDEAGSAAQAYRIGDQRHLQHFIDLTDGQLIKVAVCGEGTKGYAYDVTLKSTQRFSDETVGELVGTR